MPNTALALSTKAEKLEEAMHKYFTIVMSNTPEKHYFVNAHLAWKKWQEFRQLDLDGQDCTVTALYRLPNSAYKAVAFLSHSFTAAEDSRLFVPRNAELEPLFYAVQGFEPFWRTLRSANNQVRELESRRMPWHH
jgi:hypothetical protein